LFGDECPGILAQDKLLDIFEKCGIVMMDYQKSEK